MRNINLDPRFWQRFFDWPGEIYLGHDEAVRVHRILKVRRGKLYVVHLYSRKLQTVKVVAKQLDLRFMADRIMYENHRDFLWLYEKFQYDA